MSNVTGPAPCTVAVAVMLLGLASCASPEQGPGAAPAVQQPVFNDVGGKCCGAKDLLPIEYVRSGGITGGEDRISVASNGALSTDGRQLGKRFRALTGGQMGRLVGVFKDWGRLRPEYPAPAGAADARLVTIRYGDRAVTASDAAADVPEAFREAARLLESLADRARPAQ